MVLQFSLVHTVSQYVYCNFISLFVDHANYLNPDLRKYLTDKLCIYFLFYIFLLIVGLYVLVWYRIALCCQLLQMWMIRLKHCTNIQLMFVMLRMMLTLIFYAFKKLGVCLFSIYVFVCNIVIKLNCVFSLVSCLDFAILLVISIV